MKSFIFKRKQVAAKSINYLCACYLVQLAIPPHYFDYKMQD